MRIDAFDTDDRVLVIAEIGNNHEGDYDRAVELVEAAVEAGADAVKTQTFRTEHFTGPADPARVARLKSFELTVHQHRELTLVARRAGALFVTTPLDLEMVDQMHDHVDAFKVASGDITFYPLLERLAASGKPLVLSSGGSDLEQISRSLAYVRAGGAREVAMLHCVSAYPVEPAQANLLSIPYLAAEIDVTVGYSDHTIGATAALAAVALGARIVEKHFTLDKHLSDFRDHQLSSDPAEFAALVTEIRALEKMRGVWGKPVQPSEAATLTAIRRSIAAARDLPAGHRISTDDLTWLRPATGAQPGEEQLLVGGSLRRDVSAGEALQQDDVE